jgi:hypothetical protein
MAYLKFGSLSLLSFEQTEEKSKKKNCSKAIFNGSANPSNKSKNKNVIKINIVMDFFCDICIFVSEFSLPS